MSDARELILNTSLKLFLRKSFKEVTMKEIVTETGLSKGAFYHYFASKEQLFMEVINYFYSDVMADEFHTFSKVSLHQFYHDNLDSIESKMKAAKHTLISEGSEPFAANHYLLIFDAINILPHFREILKERQKGELKSWIDIVKTARKSGEIKTPMTDNQLARLFIYVGDGIAINGILADTIERLRKELQPLWDGLYNTVKV
jgi:TetR/AcrR family transcriptional repressor of nem operon